MLYDTEFLIAYTNGYKGVGKARAARFLAAHAESGLFISRITWMEFSSGVATRAEADHATSRFSVLEIDDKLAWHAARVRRYLQAQGIPIGDHDVWIAATALAYGLPLVSNNSRHFDRVPGLDLRAY